VAGFTTSVHASLHLGLIAVYDCVQGHAVVWCGSSLFDIITVVVPAVQLPLNKASKAHYQECDTALSMITLLVEGKTRPSPSLDRRRNYVQPAAYKPYDMLPGLTAFPVPVVAFAKDPGQVMGVLIPIQNFHEATWIAIKNGAHQQHISNNPLTCTHAP
jgi:hypothetical protein